MEITAVKSTGYDWTAYVQCDDELIVISIYGVMTIEEATAEARFSITAGDANYTDYVVMAVERDDLKRPE